MFPNLNGPCKQVDRQVSNLTRDVDSVIYIPFIPNKFNTNLLPTYSNTLSRSAEEYLLAEDLDNIQLELENLLSNVALRYRVLKCEFELLDKDEKRLERKPKFTEKQPSSPGRKKRDDLRKSKTVNKFNKLRYSPGYYPIHYNDNNADIVSQVHSPAREQKIVLPKNDLPNKFWLSVEPYCMPLTNEDLRLLDNLIEQYSGPLVPPVPELGQHFTANISEDNLCGMKAISRSKLNAVQTNMANIDANIDKYVTGPLTQRLVSALIEDNLKIEFSHPEFSQNVLYSNFPLKSYSVMRTGMEIEKKLRTELMQQNIFDGELPNSEEDEIFSEIKRLISEISLISEYNAGALRKLRDATYSEINRLGVKRKLDSTDHEILDIYKKNVLSKSKRKAVSTLEQQAILRLITEQKNLSEKLEISNKL